MSWRESCLSPTAKLVNIVIISTLRANYYDFVAVYNFNPRFWLLLLVGAVPTPHKLIFLASEPTYMQNAVYFEVLFTIGVSFSAYRE